MIKCNCGNEVTNDGSYVEWKPNEIQHIYKCDNCVESKIINFMLTKAADLMENHPIGINYIAYKLVKTRFFYNLKLPYFTINKNRKLLDKFLYLKFDNQGRPLNREDYNKPLDMVK